MKTKLVIISLLSMVILITSCSKSKVEILPSSSVSTDEQKLQEIKKLDVSDQFDVYIILSETEEKLMIEANDNLHRHIQINKSNGRLRIGLDDDINIIDKNLKLNLYITVNELNEIVLSGGVTAELLGDLIINQIELQLSGASKLSGSIFSNELNAFVTGASSLDLSGNTNLFDIYTSGASMFEGYDFETNQLISELSGACKIYTSVNNQLKVKASGASIVYYKGDGVVQSQDLEGASQIIKMN